MLTRARIRRFRRAPESPAVCCPGCSNAAGVASRPAWRRARRARQAGQDWPGRRRAGAQRARDRRRPVAERLSRAVRTFRPTELPADTVRRLEDTLGKDDGSVANLREIAALAAATSARDKIRIDLNLARGLSYYTGAIMEIVVPDLAGSLGGGGRYDNLVGMFLGRDVPACGFSLGLERIIVVMTERSMFPETVVRGAVDVMVTLWNDGLARRCAGAGRRSCARRVCASTSIRRPTSSGSSSSTRRAGTCRSWRSSATTSGRREQCRSRICGAAISRRSRAARRAQHVATRRPA